MGIDNQLILHCGAQAATRSEINAMPSPVPQGPRHNPVHHGEFLERVEQTLDRYGFERGEAAYGLNHEGAQLFGVMEVVPPRIPAMEGASFTLGFRASHNQTLPAALASGSRVFVCDNLAFSGEQVLRTKQTTFFPQRLPHLLEQMVGELRISYSRQVVQLDSYRQTRINRMQADSAIVSLGRLNVVNWSELGKVVAEYERPSHEEHAEGGQTVWRLFNAVTETMKLRNEHHPRLAANLSKGAKLHRVCDRLVAAAA